MSLLGTLYETLVPEANRNELKRTFETITEEEKRRESELLGANNKISENFAYQISEAEKRRKIVTDFGEILIERGNNSLKERDQKEEEERRRIAREQIAEGQKASNFLIEQRMLLDKLKLKMLHTWYTEWAPDAQDYAITIWKSSHKETDQEIYDKLNTVRRMPGVSYGIIFVPLTFPWDKLQNVFNSGQGIKLLSPPNDFIYRHMIPIMGYVIETWYPSINKNEFSSIKVSSLEELMKDKNKYTCSEQVLGISIGGPECGNTEDFLNNLRYGAFILVGIIILSSGAFLIREGVSLSKELRQ